MKIDTSDFDRMAKELQGKLANLYSPAQAIQNQNQIGSRMQSLGMGDQNAPGQQALQQATKNHQRDLNNLIKEQANILRETAANMKLHSNTLSDLVEKQKSMARGSAEELENRRKISQHLENERQLAKQFNQQSKDLNGLLDKKEQGMSPLDRIQSGYQSGGIKGAAGAFDKLASPVGGGIAAAGMVAAAVTAAIRTGSDTYKYFGNAPISASSASGSAMAGTVGRELGGVYGNRQAYEMAFMPEKARAAAMASESVRRRSNTQMLDAGTDLVGGALMGGLKGAAGGFALGGLATGGVMAIPGAIAGGIGGAMYGANSAYNQNKSTLLSPFSSTANADRQADLAKDFANKFAEALDGEQNKNPLKKMAAESYQNTFSSSLDSQRMMGSNYNSFHGPGGFKDSITGAGFTNELGMGMASSIVGAGGSSRSAAGNSALGLQMQRGMNLSNSGSILGSLSSGMGDAKSTEAATIKILAQGMKLGLDDSKFAEENRRFTQAAADIVSRSGASSSDDAGRVAGGFGKFVTEDTNKGIDAAKGAYEQYQGMSKETSGARGVQRASSFLSDPNLSKVSTMTRSALMKVPEEELNADNPIVRRAATEQGVTTDLVVNSVKGANQKGFSRFKQVDDNTDSIQSYMKKNGMKSFDPKSKSIPKNIMDMFDQNVTMSSAESGYTNQRQVTALNAAHLSMDQDGSGSNEQGARDKLGQRDTGKVEDKTIQGMAESSKFINDNFRSFKDTLTPAAEEIAKFNVRLKETIEILSKLPEKDRGVAFGKINQGLFGAPASPGNQSNSGKPSK
jgi:hypothetical protein